MNKEALLAAMLFGGSGTPSFVTADKGKVLAVNSAGNDVVWKTIKEFKPAKDVEFVVQGTNVFSKAYVHYHDGTTAEISGADIRANPDFLYEMGYWKTNLPASVALHNIALGVYDTGNGEEIYSIRGAASFTEHAVTFDRLTISKDGANRTTFAETTIALPSKCVVKITAYDGTAGTFVTDKSVNEIKNSIQDGCCVIVQYDLDSYVVASGSTNMAYSPIGITVNNNVVTMKGYDTFLNGAHATAGTGTTWTLA